MSENDNWIGPWVAKTLMKEDSVSRAHAVTSNIIVVEPDHLPPCTIAAVSQAKVSCSRVMQILELQPNVEFFLNVKQGAYFENASVQLLITRGIPFGTMGDLVRAIEDHDVKGYKHPNILFIERGLRQHHSIEDISREGDWFYVVTRKGTMRPLRLVFSYEYELTAEHVRNARDRYGPFDIIVHTTPYGGVTESAVDTATQMRAEALNWGPTLKRLGQ